MPQSPRALRRMIVDHISPLKVALVFMVMLSALPLAVTLDRAFFRSSPVAIERVGPPHLGELCPGEDYPVVLTVTVNDPIIATYYVSVKDGRAEYTVPDTPLAFEGHTHIERATFVQVLPWVVPQLVAGDYTRVVAVRGTDGGIRFSYLTQTFTVKENCP